MLPNLQLLEGAINNEKRATLPIAWLSAHLPDTTSHVHYRTKHELGEMPADLEGFEAFYFGRRDRLRKKLIDLLGSPVAAAAPTIAVK
ncbi:hypothetical protein [Nitrobacter hamburgensis]|uniref:hypothetical protein n=1 Tax=Nitrobacter hamburgensis TaxID=912 RepID=UPI00030D5C19|nr:hypothetical protein [Nitrobacter hamburgensis]